MARLLFSITVFTLLLGALFLAARAEEQESESEQRLTLPLVPRPRQAQPAQAKAAAPKGQPKRQPQPQNAAGKGKAQPPAKNGGGSLFARFVNWARVQTGRVIRSLDEDREGIFNFFSSNYNRIMSLNQRLATRPGPPLRLSTKGPHVGMSRSEFMSKRLGLRRSARGSGPTRPTAAPKGTGKAAPKKQTPRRGKRALLDSEETAQQPAGRRARGHISLNGVSNGGGWAPQPQPWGRQPPQPWQQPWPQPQPRPMPQPQPNNGGFPRMNAQGDCILRAWTEIDQWGRRVMYEEIQDGPCPGGNNNGGWGGNDGWEPAPRPQPQPPRPWPQPQPRPLPVSPDRPVGPVSPNRPGAPSTPDAPPATGPGSVDWRNQIPPIVDQGQCGSCWAFAALGAVEGGLAVQGRRSPVKLSEQMLVDCSRDFPNGGCNGGNVGVALNYVRANGVPTASAYAYRGNQGQCRASTGPHKIASTVRLNGEQQIMRYLDTNGPVAAIVHAGGEAWEFYRSGVIRASDCDGSPPDHAINIVGYTTIDRTPVWIIRNSWGRSWGMGGYAYLQRGPNTCQIHVEVLGVTIPN